MIAEQDVERQSFQLLLEKLYSQTGQDDSLNKIKAKAWDHFLEVGLPTRSDDVYRYIRLKKFFSRSYEKAYPTEISQEMITPYILPECAESALVFVNGHFIRKLSRMQAIPERVNISTLADAMHTYSGFLNSQWTKALKEDLDPFSALNLAMHQDGAFIYIPPNTIVDSPIQIVNIVDAQTPMLITPRAQCVVGAQSQLTIVSTQAVISGCGYGINGVVDISIEEGAHVRYVQSAECPDEDLWSFDALRASLKRNSSLKVIAATDGSETVRHDYRVVLIGENAEVMLSGVWVLQGKREAHTHVLVDHQAPNCRSMQLFKGVLDDFSRSSFEGKILVRQAAQKTEAFQLNNNLLLSDRAHADSKPNLEIFADDVKASHGATVGPLDKDQIFYMKTRGFNESLAASLLVNGFCKEVIDSVSVPSLQKQMRRYVCHQ